MRFDMARDREFLLPAGRVFIALSFVAAVLLEWLPWSGWALALRPDFVGLVLLYWCTHKPHRVGIGIAWVLGILVDVADSSLFGQHALAYAVLAFGGLTLNRRVQMFNLREQSVHVFGLLMLSYSVYAIVHWQVRGYVAWEYFLGGITSSLLWTPLTLLLQLLRRPRRNPNEL
ncbi:MAG: rod shape-determining protein MreD [Sideroxydans sp.]|nr:rod shape-determining protein MreD [Sideroxydans sp.]